MVSNRLSEAIGSTVRLTPSEQGVGDAIGDEATVPRQAPASIAHQQVEQFRRAVRPQHISGMGQTDAGPDVPTLDEVASVVGHASKSVSVELIVKSGRRGVAIGSIAQ